MALRSIDLADKSADTKSDQVDNTGTNLLYEVLEDVGGWVGRVLRKAAQASAEILAFDEADIYSTPTSQQKLSVKDLIDQFNRDQIRRDLEIHKRIIEAPADSKEKHLEELKKSSEEAERNRIRLEMLNTGDLETIDKFADAVKSGDFKKVGEIVESYKNNPAYLGKLLLGLNLELEREGLGHFNVIMSHDRKDNFTSVTVANLSQSPPKIRTFRTDGKNATK